MQLPSQRRGLFSCQFSQLQPQIQTSGDFKRLRAATIVRSLTLLTIFCLTATPAIACVFDTECKPGTSAWMVAAAATYFLAATMSQRSEAHRKGKPAATMVIAAQAPVASRARAPRVSA